MSITVQQPDQDDIDPGRETSRHPVQAPTKYELVINLKTAKALDLTVPPAVLAAPMKLSNERRNVRYWHKADIPSCTAHVRFGDKADMPICTANVCF